MTITIKYAIRINFNHNSIFKISVWLENTDKLNAYQLVLINMGRIAQEQMSWSSLNTSLEISSHFDA